MSSPGAPIRVLVVDDEDPARRKLIRFLQDEDGVMVVGEASDGASAAAAIREHEPELVFLDIRMPGGDGFEVVESLESVRPRIVFATAHAEHAVRAFEVGAVDYLLKPFDRERFREALSRVRRRIREAGASLGDDELRRLVDAVRSVATDETGRPPLRRILVEEDDRSFFLDASDISWIEAAGNYVRLHAGTGSHLIRSTLKRLAERLDPARFARVSRSAIVNLDRVDTIHDWSHGDRLLVLEDGTEVKVSRRYRDELER